MPKASPASHMLAWLSARNSRGPWELAHASHSVAAASTPVAPATIAGATEVGRVAMAHSAAFGAVREYPVTTAQARIALPTSATEWLTPPQPTAKSRIAKASTNSGTTRGTNG